MVSSNLIFFFSNNAGELRVISLRRRKNQRAGRNRPKYKNSTPTHTPPTGSKLFTETTTKTPTNLATDLSGQGQRPGKELLEF
jgi:hypothetical protein